MTQVMAYFLKILEKKDYSINELKLKAAKRDYNDIETNEALARLTETKLVDDDRLIKFLIEKYSPTRGKFWIQQKLQQRLLEKESIQKYLINDDSDEIDFSILKAKLARKYNIINWQEIDIKVKNKVLGYLSRNGFSQIYDILNNWISPSDK